MNIQRTRFYTPENIPRQTREQVAVRNEVTFSDKTISDLFKVTTPDPNDKQFLQGAKEIKAKHPSWTPEEVEIGFGRKQRTVTKVANLSQPSNNLAAKMAGLSHMTSQAAGDAKDDENILASVLNILRTEREAITTPEVKRRLQFALDTLDLPANSHEAGLPRYVDRIDDTVMAFLLAKTQTENSFIADGREQMPVNFHINERLSQGKSLDLDRLEIVPRPKTRQEITGHNLRGEDERKRTRKYTPSETPEDVGDY